MLRRYEEMKPHPAVFPKLFSMNKYGSKIWALLLLSMPIVGCQSLFYYPDQIDYGLSKESTGGREVWIENKNSHQKIHAYYFSASAGQAGATNQKSNSIVVYFHGNAQNLTSHYRNRFFLTQAGFDFFIFDYPGYGWSEGTATTKGTVDSSLEVLNWLKENFPEKSLIVYGHSIGGIIALRSLEEWPHRGRVESIILDSTFPSYIKMAQTLLSRSWLTWTMQPLAYLVISDAWAPHFLVTNIPTLVIHGRDDTLLTPSGGERTAELIPGSVLMMVADMGHDLPRPLWPLFVDAISAHVRRTQK